MSIVTLNRILLFLALAGLFVAGVLSAQHLKHIDIPCTAGRGCLTVAQHPSSYFQISEKTRIPVAYFGLAGYLFFTALAVIRGFTGHYYSKFLTISGYLAAAVGMIYSLYLQYISISKIGATCIWCMTSAGIMVLTFVFYTILFGRLGGPDAELPPTPSPKFLYMGLAGVLISSTAVGLTIFGRPEVAEPVEMLDLKMASKLVPEPRSERNQLGPDDAPVTLVEFADLCCPQCRSGLPKIHELVAKYPGKLRVVYRHFPIYQLPGHDMALQAVITAELAAQKGKFWEFADAFSAAEEAPRTMQGVAAIAGRFGISEEDIEKAMKDDESIPNKRLTRDFTDVQESFGLNSTPTFMIVVKGMPIKKMTFAQMMREILRPELQKLLAP